MIISKVNDSQIVKYSLYSKSSIYNARIQKNSKGGRGPRDNFVCRVGGGGGPMPTNFFCWYIFYVYLISFNFPRGEGGGGLGPEAPTFRSAQVYVLSHFRISNK